MAAGQCPRSREGQPRQDSDAPRAHFQSAIADPGLWIASPSKEAAEAEDLLTRSKAEAVPWLKVEALLLSPQRAAVPPALPLETRALPRPPLLAGLRLPEMRTWGALEGEAVPPSALHSAEGSAPAKPHVLWGRS